MFWRKKPLPELTVSIRTRRSLVSNALNGASLFEKKSLAHMVLDSLGETEKRNLVQQLDREHWSKIKPEGL